MFGLFRKKDYRHYITQGGKNLAAERFADARFDFEEAMRLCPAEASQEQREIQEGLAAAGDGLGKLNLTEGDHCVRAGDLTKAADHFTLAGELAFDETIKAMARERLKKIGQSDEPVVAAAPAPTQAAPATPATPAGPYGAYARQASGSATSNPAAQKSSAAAPSSHAHHGHGHGHDHGHGQGHGHGHGHGGCGSCGGDSSCHSEPAEAADLSHLDADDQFQILIHTLPGDLPQRYAEMGEKFKQAYLLIQDGNDAKAFPMLQEILVSGENDIVIYELALIMYRSGRAHECENLLKRALQINERNPVSYIALIHLLAELQRFPDALGVTARMLELGVMADQALFMQGELYQATGDETNAMECWTKALDIPSVQKSAAERLVPILDRQGRHQEVKFLAKKYLKGCC